MSRIDVPTLKCDRCGHTTQDLLEMTVFRKLVMPNMSGEKVWDICAECWYAFNKFLDDGGKKGESDESIP